MSNYKHWYVQCKQKLELLMYAYQADRKFGGGHVISRVVLRSLQLMEHWQCQWNSIRNNFFHLLYLVKLRFSFLVTIQSMAYFGCLT